MNFHIISGTLAQVTENGIELGSIFDKLKIDIDAYKDIISDFSKLDLTLDTFKLDDGKANWDAITEAIGNCDETALSYFKTLEYGKGNIDNTSASVEGMSNYLKKSGQSFKFAAVKATLLNTALNAGIFLAVSVAIQSITKALDNWIHKVEKANEAMSEAVDEYDTAKSSLESITTELKEQQNKLDELSAKDKLTYAEKGQLEELQAITKELLMQQDIEERRVNKASKDAADKTVDAYKTQYGGYDFSKEDLNARIDSAKKSGIFPLTDGKDDVIGNITAYTRAMELLTESQENYTTALEKGEDVTWLTNDVQHYTDLTEELSQMLDDNLSDLQEKRLALEEEYNKAIEKRETGTTALTSSDQDIISTYESIYDAIKMVYEYTNQNDWNNIEIADIFNSEGIEKTKEELIAMAKAGELTPDAIANYEKLNQAIQDSELFLKDNQTAAEAFCEEIYGCAEAAQEMGNGLDEIAVSFNIGEYEESIDDIQSTISTLREALDSFNSGTMTESAVLDLMQQFPSLIPYIDLAADGFGNLSEGLSVLIAQQPDSLIQSLEALKQSLNTEEERAQVDALINSLQSLSSYGDTGMEAYATAIGSTWSDTANVIQSVTDQFENLAKVQEAVADGLTISTSAAAELAQMYPEILTNAIYAGNGQIQLNEEVVKSILAGDESIINAQITKLEADKAVLEAKKSYAEAQLEMLKQVGEGEGQISKEVAQYRLDIANSLLQKLINAGMEEDKAYAAVAANMAGNMQEYNRIVGEVAENSSTNMNKSAISMAVGIDVNSKNAQVSINGILEAAQQAALAVAGIKDGEQRGKKVTPHGGGSSSTGSIKADRYDSRFNTKDITYEPQYANLDDFQSKLEIDIKGYEQAISNIDSQIELLKNLQGTFADTVNSANGGIGSHNYADKIKDLENEKDKINSALDDAKGKGSKSSEETKDEFEEIVDFFERRIKVLNNALALLKTNLDNVVGSGAKNNLIDAELGITEEKFKNYSDALNMYTQKANEALSKLPSDIAAKVKDGAVDLTTFIGDGNEEVVEAIKDYEQWADKVADCKQELAELRTAIRQLELEKFNNIMEEFSNQFDLHEDGKGLIEKQIALLKEAGELVGESFFTTQIDQSKKQLAILEEEKTKLVDQMASAVSSGRVD